MLLSATIPHVGKNDSFDILMLVNMIHHRMESITSSGAAISCVTFTQSDFAFLWSMTRFSIEHRKNFGIGFLSLLIDV